MASATPNLIVPGLGKRRMLELSTRARRLGMTPAHYVRHLVEEDLATDKAARNTTFAKLMQPVRRQFKSSGMTEAELDRIVNRARARHHARSKSGKA
jgi:hypothetical protein